MHALSVAIIAKNEAHRIAACLESVRTLATEVIVVDSGSTDGTPALCRALGARLIETDWAGYGAQKNRAVREAAHDWVLCLDADEQVTPELAQAIGAALATPDFYAYRMKRRNRFLGRALRHGEGYPDWSLRLFDRRHARWSEVPVHEKVLTDVAVGSLRGDIVHDSADTLEAYLDKQNRYSSLAAADELRAGRRVSVARLLLSPLLRFVKFYFLRLGFLDGMPGFIHITIGCWTSFLKYAKIRAGQR
jgi:glycosyltransferase involved in cell wall biosynthesis